MSQQDNNNDPKVEGMLRRWGADLAAGKVNIPPMPSHRGGGGGLRSVLRWVIPLAAAALVVVAAGVWVSNHAGSNSGAEAQLREQLAKAQEDNKKSWAAWNESQRQLRAETNRAAAAELNLKRLQAKVDSSDDGTKALQRQIAKLTGDLSSATEQLKATKKALDVANEVLAKKPAASNPVSPVEPVVPQDVVALREKVFKLQAQVQNFEDRLSAAGKELARQKSLNDELAQKAKKAQDELDAVKLAGVRQFEQAQAAYLSVAAPTEQGLRARQ